MEDKQPSYEVYVKMSARDKELVLATDDARLAKWTFYGAVVDEQTLFVELRRKGRIEQRADKHI